MLKYITSACLFFVIVCTSCKKAFGPDNAKAIRGTYSITSNSAQYPVLGDYLIITKIDHNSVKVVIDYANSSSADIVLDKMTITKNGNTYDIDRSYSTFSSTGNVNGNTCTLNLNYVSGNYIRIVASK